MNSKRSHNAELSHPAKRPHMSDSLPTNTEEFKKKLDNVIKNPTIKEYLLGTRHDPNVQATIQFTVDHTLQQFQVTWGAKKDLVTSTPYAKDYSTKQSGGVYIIMVFDSVKDIREVLNKAYDKAKEL